MIREGKTLGRLRQQLRQRGEIPIGILHVAMSQETRQDQDAIGGAPPARLPALQHTRSQGVTEVVEAWWTPTKGDALSQLDEGIANGAGGQWVASFRNKEILSQGKAFLPVLGVSPQGLARARVQGDQAGFAILAFPDNQ